jgi:hypothetical protein
MEQKLVKVPFEVELAKKITNGECDGRIVTRDGKHARVVCWDKIDENSPIVALLKYREKEVVEIFMIDGRWHCDDGEESNLDLLLEIPEYMTLKDGDVLYARTGEFWFVFIYRNNNKDRTCIYAAIDERDTLWIEDNRITSNNDISELRLATESEKQKLIDELKASKEPKAKEYLKRFFNIEQKQEYEFKPFDKVLVRDADHEIWQPAFFSCKKGLFRTIGCNDWGQCIPYEGNEHLLGTTNEFEEK